MSKKVVWAGVVFLVVVVIASWFVFSRKTKAPERATGAYRFAALEADVAARVALKNPALNGGKEVVVPFAGVLDEHYKSLLAKRQELLFLAAYEQMIASRIDTAKSISIRMEKPGRELELACNQYGVACKKTGIVRFAPQQKDFLVIDGETFSLEKLQQKTVPLLAVKTEILNHVLRRIDEEIRAKLLYIASKEAQMTAQEFIEKKVISSPELTALASQEMTRLMPNTPASKKPQMLQWMMDVKKNETVDVFIQKNYLKLPIVVNIEQPRNDFKTRWEWTPYFGDKPDDSKSVVLFVDFFSDASREAIRNFLRYREYDYDATFGVRPFFSKNDPLQSLAAEIAMCVWVKQPKVFWSYLEKSLSAKRDTVEADLYSALKGAGGDVEGTRKCVFSREMQKVVDYHIQSAQYLKIINTPVVFVGDEVHIGPIANSDLEKMLLRQP